MRHCVVCGSDDLHYVEELSADLVREWELSAAEAAYVNRQQGLPMPALRQHASLHGVGHRAVEASRRGRHVRGVFDCTGRAAIARAGNQRSRRRIAVSGEVARTRVRQISGSGHAIAAACGRRIRSGRAFGHAGTRARSGARSCGVSSRACAMPAPACSRCRSSSAGSRAAAPGSPASYHGDPSTGDGHLVYTEFGADAWTWPLAAGFADCRMVSLEHPAAHALIATR